MAFLHFFGENIWANVSVLNTHWSFVKPTEIENCYYKF